jgi:putative oxidoreductase
MRPVFVVGRIIFGGFFLYSGLNHFLQHEPLSGHAASKGVPAAPAAVAVSGAILVAGGASIITGIRPRNGLATLIAFLVPVSLQMHRFWEIDDPGARMMEMTNFMKNMALVGAALTMMHIEEPWPASVDAARASDDEMYVRLGGRELRSLPA